MRYRVTCLTPTLIGDGQRLAPIDYMVWKEHVNVLDQRRIFRLLSKGPRLDGYLLQLKRADKLDFASWGGFAQNFAGRRIPFEHPSAIPFWERAHAENLFIPTFASSSAGPYLPATSIKGAMRTGSVWNRWTEATLHGIADRLDQDHVSRNPAAKAEDAVLGGAGGNRMRRVGAGDSGAIAHSNLKVHLLRIATLLARNPGHYDLGWKGPRGSVDARRIEESTPIFAEMAVPGTSFEGAWQEHSVSDRARLFQASNLYAAGLIARHKQYAEWTGLSRLDGTLGEIETRLADASRRPDACMLSIGWGGGFTGKSACLETQDDSFRRILRQMPFYQRAIQTGLPFPKTRRIVFENGQPASLPGWVVLEVS